MTTEPKDIRQLVDDGTEDYQPIAEFLILQTVAANPQLELNQLFLLLSGFMERSRFNRAYKVVSQLRYQNLKVVINRPNGKEQRLYLCINPQINLQQRIEEWYPKTSSLSFTPPTYVTRRKR